MRQILLEIPVPFLGWKVPIFGFGLMLFLAFLSASWLIQRLARREGLEADRVVDLALWIFLGGLVGARALFIAQNPQQFRNLLDFFKIWQGGIVFYGGVAAAVLVFWWYTRWHKLPALRVLDVLAPATALGVGIGRFGCLLNGCCWGEPSDVAWAIRFPYGSIPHVEQLFQYPDQVSLGFHVSNREGAEPIVQAIDGASWADVAGLRSGDLVRRVGQLEVVRIDRGNEMRDAPALLALMREVKPQSEVTLEVERKGQPVTVRGTFEPTPPHSLLVHPTQIHLALAGFGLLALTMAFYSRRTRHGEVMALLMVGYSVSRFAIEFLRDDELPWAVGLTMSQHISIVLLAGGVLLWGWLRRQPAIPSAAPAKA